MAGVSGVNSSAVDVPGDLSTSAPQLGRTHADIIRLLQVDGIGP